LKAIVARGIQLLGGLDLVDIPDPSQNVQGICSGCNKKKQIVVLSGEPARDRKWWCLDCAKLKLFEKQKVSDYE
jgi:hypothetical protein